MCCVGDTVYAIIQNLKTFMPEVITAKVVSVTDSEFTLEEEVGPLFSYRYDYPLNEWMQSVFYKKKDAEAMVYEPEGEAWRKKHGLASPLKREAILS